MADSALPSSVMSALGGSQPADTSAKPAAESPVEGAEQSTAAQRTPTSPPIDVALPPVDPLVQEELAQLRAKVETTHLPEELSFKIDRMLRLVERAARSNSYAEEYERAAKYIEWVLKIPWEKKSEDNLDLERAKQVLETHHYGMREIKDRILEYMAILQFQKRSQGDEGSGGDGHTDKAVRAPIVLLVGLVGTGKTTFAYSIAETLGREIIRVPFGGMGSARDLRGQSRLHLEAEPGLIIKGLAQASTRNPVILLDEIDRVSEDARMDIMGVLVELLDPNQNHSYTDHYLDYPVNLSEALFIATANNTRHIATAVYDRMEHISMPAYSDEEKIVIAQRYIMPKMLAEAGMPTEAIVIAQDVWMNLVRPLGFDAGIRTLERTLKGVVAKSARLMIERNIEKVVITQENVKYFVPPA